MLYEVKREDFMFTSEIFTEDKLIDFVLYEFGGDENMDIETATNVLLENGYYGVYKLGVEEYWFIQKGLLYLT